MYRLQQKLCGIESVLADADSCIFRQYLRHVLNWYWYRNYPGSNTFMNIKIGTVSIEEIVLIFSICINTAI